MKTPTSQVKPPFFPYGPMIPLEYLQKKGRLLSRWAPLRPKYPLPLSRQDTWHLTGPDPRDSSSPKAARKPTFPGARGRIRNWTRNSGMKASSSPTYKDAKCTSMYLQACWGYSLHTTGDSFSRGGGERCGQKEKGKDISFLLVSATPSPDVLITLHPGIC